MAKVAKIMFSDFIDHFAALDDKQIVKDVRKSIEDLAEGNSRGKSFGAFIVKSTNDRIAKARKKKVEAGRKGGLALAAKYRKIKELTAQNNYQVTTPTISTDNVKLSQDAPNGNAGVDMSDTRNGAASKSPTSCDTFTADGDIREDSLAKPDGSAITRNETRAHDALEPSANHYGDAATREGAEVVVGRESGAAVPTTVSRNMRRVPQNEAPAHGFSGGRTAQGTMSRSPEAAAQSGKDYDQEPAKTRDTRDDSRGRYAPPSCSPEDGNPAETAPSHGGSVAILEARQGQARESRRTGGSSVRGMAKVAQPSVRSFGESGLVHMTDAQANSLRSYYGEDFDRAVCILENYILSLPSKAEGDEKGEAKFWREDYAKRNHYFTMRRDNWVDNALKKSKTVDIRLEKAKQNPKSFKQMDADDRTEFFSKSIFDKEAI